MSAKEFDRGTVNSMDLSVVKSRPPGVKGYSIGSEALPLITAQSIASQFIHKISQISSGAESLVGSSIKKRK